MLPGAAAVVAIGFTLYAILPPSWAVGLTVVHAWCAVPGIALARRLYGANERASGWSVALLAGPAWGYALSSVALLGLWAAGIRSPGCCCWPRCSRRPSSGRRAASPVR